MIATTTSKLLPSGNEGAEPHGTLDVATAESDAPGAEVVVDGLVHLSEGVLPAWGAMADASGLEDLQQFWDCRSCRAFGLTRIRPDNELLRTATHLRWTCIPHFGQPDSSVAVHRIQGTRISGRVPYEMPRVQAAGVTWQALRDRDMGRLRADPVGQVITLSSGAQGCGYALCLSCGRAEAEDAETPGFSSPMPTAIKKHSPLAIGSGVNLVKGYCPGGLTEPQRIQRNVRFVHAARTDVFELQLAAGATRASGLALAAGLREALLGRLGADAREIGVAVGRSTGPAGEGVSRRSFTIERRAAPALCLALRSPTGSTLALS